MLTIFSTPKGFTDEHTSVIQRNAIESWLALSMDKEIILCGDDPGVAEVCREYGIRHIGNIAVNEYGTPLLNDIFAQAEKAAAYDTMCYINCDIIAMPDFAQAITDLQNNLGDCQFMATGRRWRVEANERVSTLVEWEQLRGQAVLDCVTALDYFIFSKGFYEQMPPFAIGRWYWDTYLSGYAVDKARYFIDLASSVTMLHQNHDYHHAGLGAEQNHTSWYELRANGPEAQVNLKYYLQLKRSHNAWACTLLNAPYILKAGKLKRSRYSHWRWLLVWYPVLVQQREKNRFYWYLLKIPCGLMRRQLARIWGLE